MHECKYWILRRDYCLPTAHFHAKALLEGIPEEGGLLAVPVAYYDYRGGALHIIRRQRDVDEYMRELERAVEKKPAAIDALLDKAAGFNTQTQKLAKMALAGDLGGKTREGLRRMLEEFCKTVPKSFTYGVFLPYYLGDVSGFEKRLDAQKISALRAVSAHKEAESAVLRLAAEILRRAGVQNAGRIECVTYGELLDCLDGKKPDAGEFVSRWAHCFIEEMPGKYSICTGKEADEREREFLGGAMPANELRGKTAFKGKVTATAFVAKGVQDMNRMEKGQILVVHMTTMDFTPYLHKCAGIVTDEGGITCHAAILSRERKIPCVIGTKNATRAIRTGDLIEVDAYTGVVRKLG